MTSTESPDAAGRSKYAVLAPDARGHCSWFLTRTNKEHQATMEHPFMKTLYAKTFDKEAYSSYLASQYLIFSELESICSLHRATSPLSAVYDERLHRSTGLARDLLFWSGEDWREKLVTSPRTAAYLQQLREDAGDAYMLLCHHFLQYNAVLSGGQFLGGMVSARALADYAAVGTQGSSFYDFPAECQPTHARVQQYIDAVDELTLPAEVRDRMLGGMQRVYGHLLALFDEAYALAPMEGVSYTESKAAVGSEGSASGGSAAAKPPPPPPPLEPASVSFTLAQLQQHGVNNVQILTSLLGRVYDVTSGGEFFGAGGPYEMFAGHDGTYNLTMMTLKKQTLDKFGGYEVDADDKECLADWLAYFDNRYGRPVGMLWEQHAIRLSDLPRATKIPFGSYTGTGGQAVSEQASETPVPSSRL